MGRLEAGSAALDTLPARAPCVAGWGVLGILVPLFHGQHLFWSLHFDPASSILVYIQYQSFLRTGTKHVLNLILFFPVKIK